MSTPPRPPRSPDEATVAFGYPEVIAALRARAPEDVVHLTLTRMSQVMHVIGDPQHAFRSIQVAGTNGKTSTARFLERLLRETGLRTGLYTSPDLGVPEERIAIDGVALRPADFVASYRDLAPYLALVDGQATRQGEPRISYFEALTATAYAAFSDAPVDVAVIEVGMGGTNDATTVVDASVAVITEISLEHQAFLGDTPEEIAVHKSGIIKAGGVVVSARQSAAARDVLRRRATEVGATLVEEGTDFGIDYRETAVGGQVVTFEGLTGTYSGLFIPVFGGHQARNALCAVVAAEAFLGGSTAGTAPVLGDDLVRAALADSTMPGRLEMIRHNPAVLLDAAHNPPSAEILALALKEDFVFDRVVAVVGILRDKDAYGFLSALEPVLDSVIVTASSSPRSLPPYELEEVAIEVFGEDRVRVMPHLLDAVAAGIAESRTLPEGLDAVVVTGSITLVGEVRRLLGGNRSGG
jgi:dihydrofolate synthase/folylpolyglutamate synthase